MGNSKPVKPSNMFSLANSGKLIPPISYSQLSTGNKHFRTYEAQTSIPIDGSNQFARSLSPFIIRIIPPIVFDPKIGNKESYQDETYRLLGTTTEGVSLAPIDRNMANSNISVYNSVGSQYNSYKDMLQTRKDNVMNIFGPTGYDREKTGEYVSAGERYLESDTVTEPGIMDSVSAVDIMAQLNAMLDIPPLVLLINPSSMSINYEKVQQYNQRTRSGYVFQSWGENQPTISFSGMIGAFISGSSTGGNDSRGMQFASKRDSASYQNLMNLLTFYRNNGYVYDNISGSAAPHFVGSISIEYDQWAYVGNFNSMSWGYDDTNPNGMVQFEIEFTASQIFDNHQSTDIILPMKTPTGKILELNTTSNVIEGSSTPLPGTGNGGESSSVPWDTPAPVVPITYARTTRNVGE